MEKKNNNGILIGLLIGIVIMLLVFIVLFATNTISISRNHVTEEIEIDNKNSDNMNNETKSMKEKSVVNYSQIIGEYMTEKENSLEDIMENGGTYLKINDISENDISFEIKYISSKPMNRIASTTMEDIKNIRKKDNTYSFEYQNDGWNNTGTGTITIEDDGSIILNTEVVTKEETSQWGLYISSQKLVKKN